MNKTPIFLESGIGESGAICLAMVLAYYGSFPKLNTVKTACNASNNEILPENLYKTASHFGFIAKYNTNKTIDISIDSPIIIKTTSGVYILIIKENKNDYLIHDTERGAQKITKQKLKNIYGGWSLKLTPEIGRASCRERV